MVKVKEGCCRICPADSSVRNTDLQRNRPTCTIYGPTCRSSTDFCVTVVEGWKTRQMVGLVKPDIDGTPECVALNHA